MGGGGGGIGWWIDSMTDVLVLYGMNIVGPVRSGFSRNGMGGWMGKLMASYEFK